MPKYERIIFWSEDDQKWLVDVPELPGCMADGDTPAKALENVEKIIADWLATARELGRGNPRPQRQAFRNLTKNNRCKAFCLTPAFRRYSSSVEHQLPKLGRRVRFPLSALFDKRSEKPVGLRVRQFFYSTIFMYHYNDTGRPARIYFSHQSDKSACPCR